MPMAQNKCLGNVGFLFFFYPFEGSPPPLGTPVEDHLNLVCMNSFTKLEKGGVENRRIITVL